MKFLIIIMTMKSYTSLGVDILEDKYIADINGNKVTKVTYVKHSLGNHSKTHWLEEKTSYKSMFNSKILEFKTKMQAMNYAACGDPRDSSWRGYFSEDDCQWHANPKFKVIDL